MKGKISLRVRIFFSMILLTIFSLLLIVVATYFQYFAQNDDYNKGGILEVPCGRGKTVIALKIISLLKKKTLILVHKEFLMNQWIERIEEFLDPTTRVGKIQANVCDIEVKVTGC